ncbi:MAG: hypothetical protein DHS20C16_24670 [Phycisphaerae bacterium]|nr:MAG: hypothetical protein DHS20C16_24670 [Phycisphaerae bacterium]
MSEFEFQPMDLGKLRTYSIAKREHKVDLNRAGKLTDVGASAMSLLDSMPDYLGAQSFRKIVEAVAAARKHDRPVVIAMGAHVVKVGCAPLIIDLMERGIVNALAFNGATAIHDVELATLGQTSEEVADTIRDGSFGMVQETMSFFAEVCDEAAKSNVGLGHAIAAKLVRDEVPHRDSSILAAAGRLGIPVTVHVALGTDTVHMAGNLDAGKLGAASLLDFRLLCNIVGQLGAMPDTVGADGKNGQHAGDGHGIGGVWLNVGSAVILPEVFLKAVSVARNLGANLDAMVAANFDMQRHYRTTENVIRRPVAKGRGHQVVGHHEILLPLLRHAVIEALAR